jgi:hypothetical protein
MRFFPSHIAQARHVRDWSAGRRSVVRVRILAECGARSAKPRRLSALQIAAFFDPSRAGWTPELRRRFGRRLPDQTCKLLASGS